METEDQRLERFLDYECDYAKSEYKGLGMTWGELFEANYDHYKYLLSTQVANTTSTFEVLSKKLKKEDQVEAAAARREEEGDQQRRKRYLQMKCSHAGRHTGKTWGTILRQDYPYFMWAVGNTMGRETRTFKTFVECLKDEDIKKVLSTPRGLVKAPKKAKKEKMFCVEEGKENAQPPTPRVSVMQAA